MKACFADDRRWQTYEAILKSWQGTPYRHLTMVKGRGADCTLYLAACLLEAGLLTKVEHDYYPRDWHIHTKQEIVLQGFFHHVDHHLAEGLTVMRRENSSKLLRGDVLSFATTRTGVSNHCACYLGNGEMIHSINQRGVSETQYGGYWQRKLTAVFRFMEDE